jgi:hypothetical protein
MTIRHGLAALLLAWALGAELAVGQETLPPATAPQTAPETVLQSVPQTVPQTAPRLYSVGDSVYPMPQAIDGFSLPWTTQRVTPAGVAPHPASVASGPTRVFATSCPVEHIGYGGEYGCAAGGWGHHAGCGCGCLHHGAGGHGLFSGFHDNEEYFQPWSERPYGSYAKQILATQIHNGFQAQLAFYHFHFSFDGQSWYLTDAGQQHADTICRFFHLSPGHIEIETTRNPGWDESRRQVALFALQQRGVPVSLEHFVLSPPNRTGLAGLESLLIYERRHLPVNLRSGGVTSSFRPGGSFVPTTGGAAR